MLNQVFKVFSGTCEQFVEDAASELSMGWVNSRVGLGRYFFDFWWVGLGRGSEMAETKNYKSSYALNSSKSTTLVAM